MTYTLTKTYAIRRVKNCGDCLGAQGSDDEGTCELAAEPLELTGPQMVGDQSPPVGCPLSGGDIMLTRD